MIKISGAVNAAVDAFVGGNDNGIATFSAQGNGVFDSIEADRVNCTTPKARAFDAKVALQRFVDTEIHGDMSTEQVRTEVSKFVGQHLQTLDDGTSHAAIVDAITGYAETVKHEHQHDMNWGTGPKR